MNFFTSKKQKQQGFIQELKQIILLVLLIFFIRTFFFGLYQVPTGSMETTMLVGEFFFADKFSYLFSKPKYGDIISFNSPLYTYSNNKLNRLFQNYVWGPQNLTKRVIGMPGDLMEGKVEDGKAVIYRNGQKLDEPYLNKLPLIAVWKKEPNKFAKNVRNEAIALMTQNKLAPAEFEDFLNRNICRNVLQKSYDPAFAYDKQPFYQIKEELIIKDANGNPMLIEPNVVKDLGANAAVEAGQERNWNGTEVFRVKLTDNEYWVMGDNRQNSGDSRLFGPVSINLIHGRILFRFFSVDVQEDWIIVDMLKNPIDFIKRIRWNRALQWVH